MTELLRSDAIVATTEPVSMEVLAGTRDDAADRRLRQMLGSVVNLSFDAVIDFEGAARVYRLCRRSGVTPRNIVDCMVAAVAMRHRAALLANDADFARIAQVVALELDPAMPTELSLEEHRQIVRQRRGPAEGDMTPRA